MAALQNNLRQMGGGPQAAGMERMRRQSREAGEGVEQLSGSMKSQAAMAGVVGGAVAALSLKLVDVGISALSSVLNINQFVEAMSQLGVQSRRVGDTAAQYKANLSALKEAGISESEAQATLQRFAGMQADMMQMNSRTMKSILDDTPRELRPAMQSMLQQIAVEPSQEALQTAQNFAEQIRQGVISRHQEMARQQAAAAGLGRDAQIQAMQDVLPAAERAAAQINAEWLGKLGLGSMAGIKAEFKTVTDAQIAETNRQVEQADRVRKSMYQIQSAWGNVKTSIQSALISAGLEQFMERLAGWTRQIADDINAWSLGEREPQWLKGIADSIKQIQEWVTWLNNLAIAFERPTKVMAGLARGKSIEEIAGEVRAEREEAIPVAGGGFVRPGTPAEAIAHAVGATRVEGVATPQEAAEQAAPAPQTWLQQLNPFAAANVAREQAALGAVEQARAARRPETERVAAWQESEQRAMADALSRLDDILQQQGVGPGPAPAAVARTEEDRTLDENTDRLQENSDAMRQLTGAIQTQMSGLEPELGAGEGVVGPPAAAMELPPAPIAATEAPASAAEPGVLSRAWQGIRGLFGGGRAEAPVEARQTGGQVQGGQPYLVGESGPEIVVPQGGGEVEPDIAQWLQGAPELGPSASGRAGQVVTDPQFMALLNFFNPYGAVAGLVSGATAASRLGASAKTMTEALEGIRGQMPEQPGSFMQALQGMVGGGQAMDRGADAMDRAAQTLDQAAMQNVNVNGTGKINVDVRAPAGTRVSAEGGGLFKSTEITRQTQMLPAENGPSAGTGINASQGTLTNGT